MNHSTASKNKNRFWPLFTAIMLFLGCTWLIIGFVTRSTIYVICPGLVGLLLGGFGGFRMRGPD